MACGLAYNHLGLHWDIKHNHRWDSPVIWKGDFEQTGVAKERKRIRRKTDELAPTTTTIERTGQVHLYRPNVLAQLAEMEADIAAWEEYHFPTYTGEF